MNFGSCICRVQTGAEENLPRVFWNSLCLCSTMGRKPRKTDVRWDRQTHDKHSPLPFSREYICGNTTEISTWIRPRSPMEVLSLSRLQSLRGQIPNVLTSHHTLKVQSPIPILKSFWITCIVTRKGLLCTTHCPAYFLCINSANSLNALWGRDYFILISQKGKRRGGLTCPRAPNW